MSMHDAKGFHRLAIRRMLRPNRFQRRLKLFLMGSVYTSADCSHGVPQDENVSLTDSPDEEITFIDVKQLSARRSTYLG